MMSTTSPAIDRVLAALPDRKRNGRGWAAKCPAHEDQRASMSIAKGDDGRALLHCHAGCAPEAITAALGLTLADLMPPRSNGNGAKRATNKATITATYDYINADGELLYQVVRFAPKDFRQRRPDGADGWAWNMQGVQRVLYRLPELTDAGGDSFVFVVEGEKDADNLHAAGVIATTNPGGAGKWAQVDDAPLCGRHVVILPDADAPGRKHAQQVAAALHGKAASVRIVELPGGGKDASEWLAAGGDVEHLIQMADAAPEWTPDGVGADDSTDTVNAPGPVLVRLDSVKPRTVDWLWHPRLPLGKLVLFAGDGGLGKSMATIDIASRITTGAGWPDRPGEQFDPADVLMLSAEDDIEDTIVPRALAAGADLSRLCVLEAVRRLGDDGTPAECFADLSRDVRHIDSAVAQMHGCKLVVIDPVSAYTGKIDSHNNSEVRGMLAPLAKLAEARRVCVLMVHHLNKGQGQGALHRVMGSVAWGAAARVVLSFSKDQDDPARRLMLTAKNNLGPDTGGLACRVADAGNGQPCIAWEADPVDMTADDAMRDADDDQKSATDEAAEWLVAILADGPLSPAEVEEAAERDGFKMRTVKRAKRRARVISRQQHNGTKVTGWQWMLDK